MGDLIIIGTDMAVSEGVQRGEERGRGLGSCKAPRG